MVSDLWFWKKLFSRENAIRTIQFFEKITEFLSEHMKAISLWYVRKSTFFRCFNLQKDSDLFNWFSNWFKKWSRNFSFCTLNIWVVTKKYGTNTHCQLKKWERLPLINHLYENNILKYVIYLFVYFRQFFVNTGDESTETNRDRRQENDLFLDFSH